MEIFDALFTAIKAVQFDAFWAEVKEFDFAGMWELIKFYFQGIIGVFAK